LAASTYAKMQIGPLGFWVADTEVKSIIKGSTMGRLLSALRSVFIHRDFPDHATVGSEPN